MAEMQARAVCAICSKSFPSATIAEHTNSCFEQHCMGSDENLFDSSNPPQQPPTRPHEPSAPESPKDEFTPEADSAQPGANGSQETLDITDITDMKDIKDTKDAFDAILAQCLEDVHALQTSNRSIDAAHVRLILQTLGERHRADVKQTSSNLARRHEGELAQAKRTADACRQQLLATELERIKAKANAEKQRQADEFTAERLRLEEIKDKEVRELKKQTDTVQAQLAAYHSAGGQAGAQLPEELEALFVGEFTRVHLWPSVTFEDNAADRHFRLAESQFHRNLVDADDRYRVTEVTYLINPRLMDRYQSALGKLRKGASNERAVRECLMFHGTGAEAMQSIAREGFKIGGVDVAVATGSAYGTGVYTSENPATAMQYIKDGTQQLLLALVCVDEDNDTVVSEESTNLIQQLVTQDPHRLLPRYIVHFSGPSDSA